MRFMISRNELKFMRNEPDDWRLMMVTNALDDKIIEVKILKRSQVEDLFCFESLSWIATLKAT